jgi:transitional endoplasmic reticulum ATPase
MKGTQFEVAEARPGDVGRHVARLSRRAMAQLELDTGDIVLIQGKRTSCVVAWPAMPEDELRDVVRVEVSTRESVGVSTGDTVMVSKVDKLEKATEVVFATAGTESLKVDERFAEYLRKRLEDLPVSDGDILSLPLFASKSMALKVTRVRPRGFARMAPSTAIKVMSEVAAEKLVVPRVTYEDIGGLRDELQRVREIVEVPLKHPEVFQRLGIEPPKGILLHGPSGTGKTLIAKAVANEVNATFLSVNGPEIMGKYYGESEERLRDTFKEAKEKAPSIIFIDELDAIAPKRTEVSGEVERRVVAQLLSLMDGLKERGDVVIIGATNVPEMLDPALRRPGRFDREIEIGIPNRDGRLEILQVHTRGIPLEDEVDLNQLANMTHGYTGADIAALCKEAAMKALRRHFPEIKSLEGRVPPDALERLVVRNGDFLAAYKEMVPTSIREVYVEVPNVRWDDVGGLEEIKRLLKEAVEMPVHNPERFKKLGVRPPRGILLYGPPGCGKTLLAEAIATESGVNFIAIRGPELFSKWVGESERAVRDVFRKARLASPSVVFLDEVDVMASGFEPWTNESEVSRRVVSQLLVEMDGLLTGQNVVVIGATNRPEAIDSALIRPGRFERLVYVPPPDDESRLAILKIFLRNIPVGKDVDLSSVVDRTGGYSGADMESLCREAGLTALRRNGVEITMSDFETALSVVTPSITSETLRRYLAWKRSP